MAESPERDPLRVATKEDLRALNERELARARALGRKEAEDEQFRKETKKHFADINESIASAAKAVGELADKVSQIEANQAQRDAVNVALIQATAGQGAKKLTRFQSIVLAVAALAAAGSLALAVVQALNG